MGFLQHLNRGNKSAQVATSIATSPEPHGDKEADIAYTSGTDSDTLSLEARNEKEVQLHPDQITANAQPGVAKAEATALVWPAWALYATYGW